MSHQNEILIASIAALKADATVSGLISNYAGQPSVFTHVPQDLGESYPWVVIYGIESNTWDNNATLGFEGTMTVHSWDNRRDVGLVNTVQKAIYDALHNNSLTYSGYCNVEFNQEYQTVLRDPDGITLHGVQRFRFIIQEG
jgi:hypothetical protein